MEKLSRCREVFNCVRRPSLWIIAFDRCATRANHARSSELFVIASCNFFTKRRKKKRLKWEIYMCFEVRRKVTEDPNLKISELWTRNEMLQDLRGFGVRWMCVQRNDLHFNELCYTWEVIAWLSFLNNDFDCVLLIMPKKL